MNKNISSLRGLIVGLFMVAIGLAAPAQAPLNFSVYAGSPSSSGPDDGPAASARFAFDFTSFIVVNSAGDAFLTDPANHTIRRISAGGQVTTFAGLEGVSGSTDAKGGLARFKSPSGLALDASNNLYVSDQGNYTIRKITSAGVVTTLAGTPGVVGSANGTGPAASFNGPSGLAVDAAGTVFVADSINNLIRKITAAGVVTTLAGQAGVCAWADATGTAAIFCFPSGLALDPVSGDLFVTDYINTVIRKVTAAGVVTTFAGQVAVCGNSDGFGGTASFCGPWAITRSSTGLLYVTDEKNRNVRSITSGAAVTTLAGPNAALCSPFCPFGSVNGTGTAARFGAPEGIAINPVTGNLMMTDIFNHDVRGITLPGAVVSRIAGVPGTVGYADGTGTAAQFNFRAGGIVRDGTFIYVADTSSNTIRKVTTAGAVVTTFAGSGGLAGFTEGTGSVARFNAPYGVTTDGFGNVFVADANNRKIRLINSGGTVTTMAGPDAATCTSNGNICPGGTADGNGSVARFRQPRALAMDGSGNIYVADRTNHNIRKIDTFGNVTTFAGPDSSLCVVSGTQCPSGSLDGTGTAARFLNPQGIAVDATTGDVYVADTGNRTLRKITSARVVTTIAGSVGQSGSIDGTGAAARFTTLANLSMDASGNLLIADRGNSTLRKMTPAGVVTTIAGYANHVGSGPGTGRFARFFYPSAVITDASGNYLVMDASNQALLVSAPTGLTDLATIDLPVAPVGVARQLNTSPINALSWLWKLIRQPTGSTAALSSTTIRNPTHTPDIADLYTYRVTATSGANSATTEVSLRTALAPRLNKDADKSPSRGQVGQVVSFQGQDLSAGATFYFSNGTSPVIAATPLGIDVSRGFISVRVPVGAQTGYLKLTSGGVDTPLFYFRVEPGTFNPGTLAVTGRVTRASDTTPVVGAAVLALQSQACSDGESIWEFSLTNASGDYSLLTVNGNYLLLVFSPAGSGLSNGFANVTVAGAPVTQNFALNANILVTGTVISAVTGQPLPNSIVNFDGNGFELVLTDDLGRFFANVAPGVWDLEITPPPGQTLSTGRISVTINPAPTAQDLGNLTQAGGVAISGIVTRTADGSPMASVEVRVQDQSTYTDIDRRYTTGDGSYSVAVPANGTYRIEVDTDTNSTFVSNINATVAVTTLPVTQNFSIGDAGYITGMVRNRVGLTPLENMGVTARRVSDGMNVAWESSCADGTYRLRVPPATNLRVMTENNGCTSCNPPPPPAQAPIAWNGNANGTFFTCEGTSVSVPTVGATVAGIDFNSVQAATINGLFTKQLSACSTSNLETSAFANSLQFDDGSSHACNLGNQEWSMQPPGTYSWIYLPPTAYLVSGNIRARYNGGSFATQNYNLKKSGFGYNPITTIAGGTVNNINFCLGNQPTTQATGLLMTKSGASNLQLNWTASTDLYQTEYRVWASNTATPVPLPGNFPTNPMFNQVGQTGSTSLIINSGVESFYLITNNGPTGLYGPSGSYGN